MPRDAKPVPSAIFVGHVPELAPATSAVDEIAEATRDRDALAAALPPAIPMIEPAPIRIRIDASEAFRFGLFATIGAAVAGLVMFLALVIFVIASGRHIPG